MREIHFVAGLRSGSTVFQAIMDQNLAIYAGNTSGLIKTLLDTHKTWYDLDIHRANDLDLQRLNVLRGIIEGYYEHAYGEVILDKNRDLFPAIELLEILLDRKIKVVVFVRDVLAVLGSLELLYRQSYPTAMPKIFREFPAISRTTAGRCEIMMGPTGLVGRFLNELGDAFSRGYEDRLMLVDYDRFTIEPVTVLEKITSFLSLDSFDYDLKKIKKKEKERDTEYGFVGLHDVRSELNPVYGRAEILQGVFNVEDRKPWLKWIGQKHHAA